MHKKHTTVNLSDLIANLERTKLIVEALGEGMSAGGTIEPGCSFGAVRDHLVEAIYAASAIDSAEAYTVFVDENGILRAGSERKATTLTEDDIKSIRDFGLF